MEQIELNCWVKESIPSIDSGEGSRERREIIERWWKEEV